MELMEILQAAVAQDASDIVLKDAMPPMFRIGGQLAPAASAPPMTFEAMRDAASEILRDDAKRMRFATERQADLAFDVPDVGRFRVNVFHQRGKVGIVMRVIPVRIRSTQDLHLPAVVDKLANERSGLILVTGPTGCGKSTTLAAMIDCINLHHARHIITIEDPIEYVHQDHHSIVSQREIGEDVEDFPSALRAALRQNPDIVMVGEMRDLETIETAITAAETGHLVLSTLHTLDAPETINRIINAFPEFRRDQVRLILATVIRGVVSQRLIRLADGSGVLPAVEVMVGSARVREYIEKQKIRELPSVIAQGQTTYGMQTFDQSLTVLFRDGKISYEDALAHCRNPADFELQARGLDTADNRAS